MLKNVSRSVVVLALLVNAVACGAPPAAAPKSSGAPGGPSKAVVPPTPSTPVQTPYASVTPDNKAKTNQFWWPEQLDLSPLRQHAVESNPLGEKFDYAKAFATLDLNAVKS